MSLEDLITKRDNLKKKHKHIEKKIASHPDSIAKQIQKGKKQLNVLLKDAYEDKTERREKERLVFDSLIGYTKNIQFDSVGFRPGEDHDHYFHFNNGWIIQLNIELEQYHEDYDMCLIIKKDNTKETIRDYDEKAIEHLDEVYNNKDGYEMIKSIIDVFGRFFSINLFECYFG